MGKKGKKAHLQVHGCGVMMNLRSIEETKLALAVPNDRRHDALFAVAPELIVLCSDLARRTATAATSRVSGLTVASDLAPCDTVARVRAVGSLAEQLRHRTVEAINQLLLASCEDEEDEDKAEAVAVAVETRLITELGALAQLAADGVRRLVGGSEETQRQEDEEEENERRLLESMRSACGHVESLFARAHTDYAASTLDATVAERGRYEPLAAQVVSQLVGVVDSIVSAGGQMRVAANAGSLLQCNNGQLLVGMHAHLACAVDAQLHLLSALVRGDGGQIQAELLRERAPGVEFLAATLEHEHLILIFHQRDRAVEASGGKRSTRHHDCARERIERLCRQAAEIAQRLRRRSGECERRQEDLDELNRLGVALAAAAVESRKLAALANHATAASPLSGSGPATPKLPREEPGAGWAEVAGGGATVESIIMPAVVATSRFHAALAAHRLSTSHKALCLLGTDGVQTTRIDGDGDALLAKLRNLFRRCGTLSALAMGIVVDRLHNQKQTRHQQRRRRLCGVGAADIVRQQVYAAVFEINKLSLVLHTASSALDAVWPTIGAAVSGLGAHDRAGDLDAALAKQGEELAQRIAARLGRFEAQVARALPPITTADDAR